MAKLVEWISVDEIDGWLQSNCETQFVPIFSVDQILFDSPDRLKTGLRISNQARRILLSGFGNGLDRLFEDLIQGRTADYYRKGGTKHDKVSPCPSKSLAVQIANELIRLRFSPTRYGYLVVEKGEVVHVSNVDDGKYWSARNFALEAINYVRDRFPDAVLEYIKIFRSVDLLLRVKRYASYWFYLWVSTTPFNARKFHCSGGLGNGDWVLLGPKISVSSRAAYKHKLAFREAIDRGIQWFLSFPWQKVLDRSKSDRLNWGSVKGSLESTLRDRLRKGDFQWLIHYGREVIDKMLVEGKISASWFDFAVEFSRATLNRRIDKSFYWCQEAFRIAFPKEGEL